MRVTPLFQPATLSDVVLVTSPAIDRAEFLCWSYALQLAGLSINFWDLERYKSLSHEDFTWVGTCKHLFFPVHPNQMAPLSALDFCDLILHFQSSPDASMLIWGGDYPSLDALTYDFTRPVRGTLTGPQHVQPAEYIRLLHPPKENQNDKENNKHKLSPEERAGLHEIYIEKITSEENKLYAPWIGCAWPCCVSDETAYTKAKSLRDDLMEQDGYRMYTAAVEPSIQSAGCCSYQFGKVGIYRAVLPKTAKLAMYINPPNANPLLQSSPLPFQSNGRAFNALDTPLAPGSFTSALLTIISLLPTADLMKHHLNKTYLSSRKFIVPNSNKQLSFTDIISSVLYHRLRQEFDMPHKSGTAVSAELLTAMKSLNLPSFGPDGQLTQIASVRAYKYLIQETKWSAFPWCCTAKSRRRDQLADHIKEQLKELPDNDKDKIISAAENSIEGQNALVPFSFLTPRVHWPLYTRTDEFNTIIPAAYQYAAAEKQIAGWANVARKTNLWQARAMEAMRAAQEAEANARRYQEAYALQMAAYMYQLGQQQMANVAPPPSENFRELQPTQPKLQFEAPPSNIAEPSYGVLSPGASGPEGFIFSISPGGPAQQAMGNMTMQSPSQMFSPEGNPISPNNMQQPNNTTGTN